MRDEHTFDDAQKLQSVCIFINDMIADTDVVAYPGDRVIAWKRRFPGHGEYEISRNEAYMKLAYAGHNPKKLIEFAKAKYG